LISRKEEQAKVDQDTDGTEGQKLAAEGWWRPKQTCCITRRRSGVGAGNMSVVRSQSTFMYTSAVLRQRASASNIQQQGALVVRDYLGRHEHRNIFSIYNPNLVPRSYELPGIKIQNDPNEHNKHVTTTQIRISTARWAS
jgi:hypothetical protein